MNEYRCGQEEILQVLRRRQADLDRLGVKSLALFGSTVRGEAREDSDIDLLVEFQRPVGIFEFVNVEQYLEDVLGKPGSQLCVSVPNRDRLLLAGVAWDYPPHHHTRWSVRSLDKFLAHGEFRVLRREQPPIIAERTTCWIIPGC